MSASLGATTGDRTLAKRLVALTALAALSTASLAGCSPPTIGQLAIHRLADGSLNAVLVGCEPGLQQVTAYVGELSDAVRSQHARRFACRAAAAGGRQHGRRPREPVEPNPEPGRDQPSGLDRRRSGQSNVDRPHATGSATLAARRVCVLRTEWRCPLRHATSLPCRRVSVTRAAHPVIGGTALVAV